MKGVVARELPFTPTRMCCPHNLPSLALYRSRTKWISPAEHASKARALMYEWNRQQRLPARSAKVGGPKECFIGAIALSPQQEPSRLSLGKIVSAHFREAILIKSSAGVLKYPRCTTQELVLPVVESCRPDIIFPAQIAPLITQAVP